MKQITCPNCNYSFDVESNETMIAKLRNEVEKEVARKQLEWEMIANKDAELKMQQQKTIAITELNKMKEAKDREIAKLNSEIQLFNEKQKQSEQIKRQDIAIATNVLQSKLQEHESKKMLAINEAVNMERQKALQQKSELEKRNLQLQGELSKKDQEKLLNEKTIKDGYEFQIRLKEEEIERIKGERSKLHIKLLGESLEQHCEISYQMHIRPHYPKAYFEKDNESVKDEDEERGTKGDYIFKDYDEHGNLLLSIMFEMKNEDDNAVKRKKNEDHFDKLDKDRNKKKCEYAVLVSTLEKDSELYNQGIVDMSYKHAKMYVIRPQFFIPLITILKNAAVRNSSEKAELMFIKQQNVDITNFENKIEEFKEGFLKNYNAANNQFDKAISEIDKTIEHLQKTKDGLYKVAKHLGFAADKTEKLTIRSLTRNNQTMRAKFDELENKAKHDI